MEKNPGQIIKRKSFGIPGVRYLFALNGMLGFATIYALRMSINVVIVNMVNSTAVYNNNNLSTLDECKSSPPPSNANVSSVHESSNDGEFVWSSELQGVILGAFYYGYCISQIPGGRMAELFSGKWVFGIGTVVSALLTLLTPVAARYHVGCLIAIRVLEGLAQGVTLPAMNFMLGRWLPDSEKGILNTIVRCGTNIGTVTAMPLVGYLCDSEFLGGWPSAFYVIGIFGCLWFLLWCFLVTDSPLTHPFITQKEIDYITSNQKIDLRNKLPPVPWKKIFTSFPFLVYIVMQTAQDWAFYTLMTDLPTFFGTVLHINIKENGFYSSFPNLLKTIVGLIVAFAADVIIRRGVASTSFVRKFCSAVGGFGTVAGLIGVCFSACNVSMNVLWFMFTISVQGFFYGGFVMTVIEMSPEYTGTLFGISNTIGNLPGFLAPLVVGILTSEQNTLHQWRIVFVITSGIMVFSTTVFMFFSSSEKQDWIENEQKVKILNTPMESIQVRGKYGSLS